jgi:hypothetical protein
MADYVDDNMDDYHDETESQDMSLSPDMMGSMNIVEQVMGEELEKLKARKAKLREGQRALNKIRERIEMVSCNPTNRLKLNVGGKKVELKMSHVERNNFFRPLLTNAFTQPDSEGFYFIDRDPTFIMVVVNYLRGGLSGVDLDLFTPAQLRRILRDAEFYMVQGLQDKVDELLRVRGPSRSITCVNLNTSTGLPARYFNGIFLQITPVRNMTLHSIAFICGEKRPNFVARALLRETDIASLTPTTQLRTIGEVDQPVEKGQKVTISMTALSLQGGKTYTIGVYSSASAAVGGCPTTNAERRFDLFTIDSTFYTTDPRHVLSKKTENDFDMVGEIYVSAA